MRHWLKINNAKNEKPQYVAKRIVVLERSDSDSDREEIPLDVHRSEPVRSYRDAYVKFRFAINHPAMRFIACVKREAALYGLPAVWGLLGTVVGLGMVAMRHQIRPAVNLPTHNEMRSVFAVHDFNQLIGAEQPQVRTKP